MEIVLIEISKIPMDHWKELFSQYTLSNIGRVHRIVLYRNHIVHLLLNYYSSDNHLQIEKRNLHSSYTFFFIETEADMLSEIVDAEPMRLSCSRMYL